MNILRCIVRVIFYSIGYIIFIKLNKSKVDNCWKYAFIYIYIVLTSMIYSAVFI